MRNGSRFYALRVIVFAIASAACGTWAVHAEETRATRVALKDLDGHFPMSVPKSLDAWQARADELRLQLRVALGVHPLPKWSNAAPTIHGRIELDGYSLEKIYFESLPGLFVTASLYRPLGQPPTAGFPAVLYAHGHWENGRFYEAAASEVRQLLATGAERFENAAINHMQAACVQLARMGCVVLQYDMLGYADSQQISFDRAHLWGRNVANPNDGNEHWLLFDAQAEGYSQSVMSLQMINSLRAFEVVSALPDVNEQKIAITGASGGGTQSFITAAIEPRLAGALPAVMVSTGMQGGCTCENACGLRIGTGNVEIAALIAPRPLGMTTAKDWTINLPTDGFPQLQELYSLFGNKSAVQLFPGDRFPHNYNHVARVAMYGWMNRLFDLKLSEPILERDFELVRRERLTVWSDEHPAPPAGLEFERKLLQQWTADIKSAVHDQPELLAEGWTALTQDAERWAERLQVERTAEGQLLRLSTGEAATTVQVADQADTADGQIRLWLTRDARKAAAVPRFTHQASLVDPLGGDAAQQPLVANPRPAAAYTYGYNSPSAVRRTGVLLRLIDELHRESGKPVELVVNPAHAFVAAAAGLRRDAAIVSQITVVAAEAPTLDGFAHVDGITHPDFVPGSLRYQGLRGLISAVGESRVKFTGGK